VYVLSLYLYTVIHLITYVLASLNMNNYSRQILVKRTMQLLQKKTTWSFPPKRWQRQWLLPKKTPFSAETSKWRGLLQVIVTSGFEETNFISQKGEMFNCWLTGSKSTNWDCIQNTGEFFVGKEYRSGLLSLEFAHNVRHVCLCCSWNWYWPEICCSYLPHYYKISNLRWNRAEISWTISRS